MAGTVTGENANVYMETHAAGTLPTFTSKDHTLWGIADFSLTFDRGTVEQDLIGQAGNYFEQGSLSIDGSLTVSKFAESGACDALRNIVDGTGGNKYFAISGNVSDGTDATYLKWFFVSCQITGYDFSIGDADTVTEASIDFMVLYPSVVEYTSGIISDSVLS